MGDKDIFTTDDYIVLLQLLNAVSIPGSVAERVVELKRKLSQKIQSRSGA